MLQQARVERCDLFIASTGLDEVNIVGCALARRLGAAETICFVSKDDFLHPPGGSDSLRAHFGINQVIWPEAQLAAAIEVLTVLALLRPEVWQTARWQPASR